MQGHCIAKLYLGGSKMKNKIKYFISGSLTSVLVLSMIITSFAAYEKTTISVDPINIQVNGEIFQPKDANGNDVPVFAYNGTTYAPLRALAEAYGLTVGYDAEQNMATVTNANTVKPVVETDHVIVTDTFKITIESVELTKSLKRELLDYTADPDKSYIFAKFAAENISDKIANSPISANFNTYLDNKKITNEVILGEIEGHMTMAGAVSPGKTAYFYTVWQVPDDSQKIEFNLFWYDADFKFHQSDFYAFDIPTLKEAYNSK